MASRRRLAGRGSGPGASNERNSVQLLTLANLGPVSLCLAFGGVELETQCRSGVERV